MDFASAWDGNKRRIKKCPCPMKASPGFLFETRAIMAFKATENLSNRFRDKRLFDGPNWEPIP